VCRASVAHFTRTGNFQTPGIALREVLFDERSAPEAMRCFLAEFTYD